ncbi:MAG: ubiquitin-specific protease ubp2 [Cirrosporium novae-zelandiae]|nr:MAG: ubiquitin-specific protease ubp2 [Cirrosporium novae-zelandiae]
MAFDEGAMLNGMAKKAKVGGKSEPGKTAPILIRDLHLYDSSVFCPPTSNILTDPAPQFEHDKPIPRKGVPGDCHHRYILKQDQSELPAFGTQPDGSTLYRVAATCSECRCHLTATVDFRSGAQMPCPNAEYPLHHFLYLPEQSCPRKPGVDRNESWDDAHVFQCSSPSCCALVKLETRSPRLTPEFVKLLTDPDMIKQRYEAAVEAYPMKFDPQGKSEQLPIKILSNLYTYLFNVLTLPAQKRQNIAKDNRQWLLSFGSIDGPCSNLLRYLGFSQNSDFILPPSPDLSTTKFCDQRQLLDDVRIEAFALWSQRPGIEQQNAPITFQPQPALRELERTLGCLDYDKHSDAKGTRSSGPTSTDPKDHYIASLGALPDFSDQLVLYCYNRQKATDPEHSPYYLECLQELAKARSSEYLQTEAVMEESKGAVSRKDIVDAYKYFCNGDDPSNYDDETIIGLFNSRVSDSKLHENEARNKLRLIAEERQSRKILDVVNDNTMTTYQDALNWLDIKEDYSDDFVVSLYEVKMNESPSDREISTKALRIIADKRNSDSLKSFLLSGQLGEVEMDIGQAYTRLGISDRTIDDDIILATYYIKLEEAPSQLGDLRTALKAIARSRDSDKLLGAANDGRKDHNPAEWPIGLLNRGNTCYLNSLLQFYFTIKPLRELVLDFDDYKMDINDETLKNKQVGSRKVGPKEVERAQEFVNQLAKLFRDMIQSPRNFMPEKELARLTLVTSNAVETLRRRSTITKPSSSIGQINGMPVMGPLGPPPAYDEAIANTAAPAIDQLDQNGDVTQPQRGDASSEATLVSPEDPMVIDSIESQQNIFENKENLAPNAADVPIPPTPEYTPPFTETSPSRMNEQPHGENPDKTTDEVNDLNINEGTAKSPKKAIPPPVPPRPKPKDDEEQRKEEEQRIEEEIRIGAQQDVTEVIANVLFQLECAMKPVDIDENGEQLDEIKHLFYGKTETHTLENDNKRSKVEFFTDIKVSMASGPQDIYSALDGSFDRQVVDLTPGKTAIQYSCIKTIPPVLQILVHRAQFDANKGEAYKSHHYLELQERIFLDRYMQLEEPELILRREDCWRWKDELRKLESRKVELMQSEADVDVPEGMELTRQHLLDIQQVEEDDQDPLVIDPALVADIEEASTALKEEVEKINVSIKDLRTSIQSQFADLRKIPYRLHSVFIHRGRVSFGHYWIYIYDFKSRIWRKYNDDNISEVANPQQEIFSDRSQEPEFQGRDPPTPYFLVYIREGLDEELVETVKRYIKELPPAERQPSTEPKEMEDIVYQGPALPPEGLRIEASRKEGNWDANGVAYDGVNW